MTVAAADIDNSNARTTPAATWLFAAYIVAAIALLHPTAFDMAQTWATSSSYTHGFFIAPVAIWMIARYAPIDFDGESPFAGYGISMLGAAIWILGAAANAAIILQFAFVTILIGGVGVIFGKRALAHWAYPLGFLYFMVPFGEALVPYLQTITAHTVVGLMAAAGMSVSLDGYLIDTPGGAFEIAVACAGLKFLIAATVVAAVFAYISFSTWRGRIGFLIFAIAVGIAANGLRAFILVLIATVTEKRFAVGPDHILIGWVFYAAVFAVLFLVGRKFSSPPARNNYSGHDNANVSYKTVAPLFAALVVISVYNIAIVNRPIDRPAPHSLAPFSAEGWRLLAPPSNWRAPLAHADQTISATYMSAENTVYLSTGFFTHDRRNAEIIGFQTRAYDGETWRRHGETQAVVYLFGRSELTPVELLSGPERRKLAAVYAYWLDDRIFVNRNRLKFEQMKAKLSGHNPRGGVVIIAAHYHRDPQDAVDAIRAFTADVETFAKWRARNFSP